MRRGWGARLTPGCDERVRGARTTARPAEKCFPWERGPGMSHLTFAEAGVVGLLQGVTDLFPVSSLGHAVLTPALVGGQWEQDLDVSRAESPYLAYILGPPVSSALAMIAFFWRDWIRIIGAFFASLRHFIAPEAGTRRFEPQGTDQPLACM